MQASDSGSSAARITPQSSLEDARRLLFAPEVAAATTSDEILIASEIAQAQGDLEFAVDCMEILLAREPDDLRWRHRHAEFLVRSGELAAAEKSCLTSISADVRFHHAHRLLVHVRVLQGNLEGALIAAQTQETSCGSTFDSGYAIAQLLYRLERLDGALEAIHRINDRGPPTEASLLLNFEIAYRLSIQHEAQAVAERAVRLWPEASAPLAKLGHLLCDARSYTEAARTLQRARQADPQNVSLAHLHAIALRGAGDYRAALEAATFALSKDPDNCEYLYVVATVHDRLGERKRALACLRQALEIEPRRVSLHVALAHMLGNGGELDAAIQQLDVARTLVPDNASIRDLRLSFLAQRPRGFSIDRMAEANVTAARPIAPMPRARHRGTSDDAGTMARRLRIQMRVIVTLVLRDFRHRAVHSRFAIFAVFLPQALQIVTLGVVLSLFNHGRPPVGDHLFFFYATGVMPFYLFIHVIDHSQYQFFDNYQLFQVPIITRLDTVLAMALTEFFIGGAVVVVTFSVFALISYGPISNNYIECVFAMMAIWLFSFGLGLIIAIVTNLYRSFSNVWLIMQRFLYITSGVFFVPQNMPEWARDILVWNPVLQSIDWFRSGIFEQYDPPWLDKPYLVGAGFATTVIGLMMERALRRRMKAQ